MTWVRKRQQALVNAVMNLRIPCNAENFFGWAPEAPGCFGRKNLLQLPGFDDPVPITTTLCLFNIRAHYKFYLIIQSVPHTEDIASL
jgi:hypothetical protein